MVNETPHFGLKVLNLFLEMLISQGTQWHSATELECCIADRRSFDLTAQEKEEDSRTSRRATFEVSFHKASLQSLPNSFNLTPKFQSCNGQCPRCIMMHLDAGLQPVLGVLGFTGIFPSPQQ